MHFAYSLQLLAGGIIELATADMISIGEKDVGINNIVIKVGQMNGEPNVWRTVIGMLFT